MSIIAKIEADAAKVKAAVLKGIAEVDGVILPDVEKYEPFVAALMNAIVPGAGNIAQIAENSLIGLAKVIDAGGAAAEANLTNLGFDTALIADAKGLIPALKAAVKT
jgi:hypothetical protein